MIVKNDLITVADVAVWLQLNPQTIYRKCKAKQIPFQRIGTGRTSIRFSQKDLEKWLTKSSKKK